MKATKLLPMGSLGLCICVTSFAVAANDQVPELWQATSEKSAHSIYLHSHPNTSVFEVKTASDESNGLQTIISGQLDAFSDNDFRKAFLFAHFSIVLMFETPENFAAMVQRDWPMLLSPKEVTFLESIEGSEVAEQDVKIVGQNGVAHYIRYFFTKSQGTWKISGVEMIRSSGAFV